MDESSAVRASQAGDRVAFGCLIDLHYKNVYRLAYQFTGSHHDADDICQETFLRAFVNIMRLKNHSHFRQWVFTIALNLLRGWIKQIRRESKIAAKTIINKSFVELSEDKTIQPFETLSSKEKAMIIHKHLREMPDYMRLVAILILMEGFSQRDAAAILSCSEASVSRHLDAARNWLRAKLQNLI